MMLSKQALSYMSPKERQVAEARMQDQLRHEKIQSLAKDAKMEVALKSDERVEKKRFLRRLQEEEHERQMDEALLRAEEIRRLKEVQLEQEERMAKEIARINHEKLKDEKTRQQVRENSIELRELENKLKSAYLNRERAAQVAEKEVLKYEQMKRDSEYFRSMKEEQERAIEEENSKGSKRNVEKMNYQRDLEMQLEEKERMRQEAYQVFLKEKLLIDEIVRKIYEEDQTLMIDNPAAREAGGLFDIGEQGLQELSSRRRGMIQACESMKEPILDERQLKLEKLSATQRYIEEFKQQQAEWRRMERQKMEAENKKIIEFANMQQRREQDRMAEVREREQRKLALQNMLAEHIQKEQMQRDELEQIRQELYLEEQAQADRQKQIAEMEKKIRQRLELQKTFQEQMAYKQIVLQAAKEEDEAFMRAMMAKFAEDDRIEQMNAQKRRMKQLEHKRAVEKLLEDRHKQLIADKERELQEKQLEEGKEAWRRAIIEEERQKLLREHASKLLGFLPKGIFKDEEDLNLFDEDFRNTFQQRRADLFSDEGWEN